MDLRTSTNLAIFESMDTMSDSYQEFLKSKVPVVENDGFEPESHCPEWFKPHQVDCCQWAITKGRAALFESFGMGKCHGKGTLVLMFDGSIKPVEDVQVGDQLMGDDGTPRNVLSLARGREQMYQVTLKNGDSYTCNESHIFSLKMSNKHGGNNPGEIVAKSLREFQKLPEYAKRNCYKHYKVSIDFESQPVPFDPYLYGAWIGDGHAIGMSWTICDKDPEILESIRDYADRNGMSIRTDSASGCKTVHLNFGPKHNQPHAVRTFLRESASGGKRIHSSYLRNDRETRLQLLAGIADTDGHLIDKTYEVATKWIGLRDDILYLSRSLGFSVSHSEKIVNGVVYYRIWISGNTDLVPCKTRKHALPRRQIKNPLVYGFTVSPLGEGDYYGFEIDGNHLYLLADFTVTHNTVQQLQLAKWVHERTGGKFLIVAPLGVRQEFTRNDGPRMGMKVVYCRTDAEVAACDSPYIITNYERVRDGGISPDQFAGVSLDEASCLRSYGSKTSQNFCRLFRNIPFRFVATATPSPNDFIELINYADFLGIMDRGQAMTRFFQRDSKEAGNLQLYPHEEQRFWLWVASWAVFINKPSDLGYDDTGYDLPEIAVHWHEVQATTAPAGSNKDKDGTPLLFARPTGGIKQVAKKRRDTREVRVAKAAEIIAQNPDDHWIIWHYLEAERDEIQRQIPDSVAVYGTQDIDDREQIVADFADGKISKLSSKPELLGSGCNFQRHCHKALFIGPTDKFNDFIQAVHRIHRFMQSMPVEIHIIFADSQFDTVQIMQRKWAQHDELTETMRAIIRENGLSGEALKMKFQRDMGTARCEASGDKYRAIHNDCVLELQQWEDNSVDEIVTSIPFSDHYEYSPNFNDFGHNQGDEGFFAQFDFLVPELYRVLKPGRVAAIHTKDRIQYGTMTGHAMYSVNEFSDKTVTAFKKHGWIYMGRIVIDTDVVRENSQTYRLGHTENSKDSTKMGCGSTEYVLLFRKWDPAWSPNQTANGPDPVTKDHAEYSRARWQIHAAGIWRSNGNELVTPNVLAGKNTSEVYHWWRNYAKSHGYDYHDHVAFTEFVEQAGHLPANMMLFAPVSNNPEIWTDILRIKTLNTDLSQKAEQNHVCPLQLDVIERLIERFSKPGETILDPFGGVMSVPYQAVKMKRRGVGIELNPTYWKYGVAFCERAEKEMLAPTLFDLEEVAELVGAG